MAEPLLQIRDLKVSFAIEGRHIPAVDGVSYDIAPGEIVGLVGESGSGKSVTAMSALRLVPCPPGIVESGEVLYGGQDLLKLPIEDLRKLRGKEISVIFQEPMTALSPLQSVGDQLAEAIRIHDPKVSREQAWARALEWLGKVGIPDPAERAQAYPFQFSGGMRQRVMIAMALILHPKLIIADEPTTALDVTLQAQIFELILEMKAADTSILFITHDMGVIWELADRVIVMKNGKIVESGPVESLFAAPSHPYTQELLAAVPRLTDEPRPRPIREGTPIPLISVEGLRTWFPVKRGVFARTVDWVKAVDDVSFEIFPGECLGLVGESGSGKSTLGRSILRLDPAREGSVRFDGTDLLALRSGQMHPFRRNLQMIFQDPFSSLNPRLTVQEILTEGLIEHGILDGTVQEVAAHWLTEVGLSPDTMNRYPNEFSGGQRQRICVARAVALRPKFVVCDEAVSALDVTIQAQVIDLLMELQEKFGIAYLFISHDLSVVKRICERVVVMRHGKVVEAGLTGDLVSHPQSDYTRKLIAAVPIPGDAGKRARSAGR